MASVLRSQSSVSARTYISAASFENDIFSYKNSVLGAVTGASPLDCPAGRVLRENGKKLYPGPYNVGTYMVGVYDALSLLSGFIDPNSPVFAVYNTNKPYHVADGHDPNPYGIKDLGSPVYTNGPIIEALAAYDCGQVDVTWNDTNADSTNNYIWVNGLTSTGVIVVTPNYTSPMGLTEVRVVIHATDSKFYIAASRSPFSETATVTFNWKVVALSYSSVRDDGAATPGLAAATTPAAKAEFARRLASDASDRAAAKAAAAAAKVAKMSAATPNQK